MLLADRLRKLVSEITLREGGKSSVKNHEVAESLNIFATLIAEEIIANRFDEGHDSEILKTFMDYVEYKVEEILNNES